MMTVRQPAMEYSKTEPKKTCRSSVVLDDDEIIVYITRECFQAVALKELRRLLYPRTITMKVLKPTKGCKSSKIHQDDETLPEEFTREVLQAMSLEVIRRLLYPRTIIMEELACQTDNVKSGSSDKKSQGRYKCRYTNHPMTSERNHASF